MFVIRRETDNPILSPDRAHPWEAVATYNPSALHSEDGTRIYYRAVGSPDALTTPNSGLSTIGTAFSEDGVHFHSRKQVIAPVEPWEQFGCEDPRVTFFEGRWYAFYTALGGFPFGPDNIKVGVAIGDAPDEFTEKHLVTPFNAKAATLFPERIGGDVVLMLTAHTDWTAEHPRPTIGIACARRIEDFWDPAYWQRWHATLPSHALPELRRADDDHIEVGATPLRTKHGWLLIYSYIQHFYDEHRRTFGLEAAILDNENPQRLVSRTYPFLVPEEIYERYGLVPNIVFPSGATVADDTLDIWYGAADTVCAKATTRLSDILRALDPSRPARTLTRAAQNPILEPRGSGFEETAAFNTAAFDLDGSIHLLYRAMGKDNTSVVGYARSQDGMHIDERLDTPIYIPRADFEQKKGGPHGNSGCEDPRAVVINDRLYMTYTAYDGVHPPHGALTSLSLDDFRARRFDQWSMPHLVTPDNVDDKDLGLLPATINGNYLLYHRISNHICADLLPDLSLDKRISRCINILGPREGMWDAAKVGIAGPPIPVDGGWLLIYHGVSHRARYRLGAVLLDPTGTALLARTADPILEPVEPYERDGEVHNVVFSCGGVVRDDTLFVYYGGGDRVTGVATGSLSHVLDALKEASDPHA
ncbi:MAG: hypothetical protein B7X04_03150 [Parcubacteria group bacterium 21-54-25]|nr:MAG: hypothetical protein B7X04_03150 [Parcubacteria group bacterium 21-54-25]HQU07986.1 hypothetical protein [Candidatus Paceibacterota bacterium]